MNAQGTIEKILRKSKLQDIHYDEARYPFAVRKGSGGGPATVFDAHMDTVFQPGLKSRRRFVMAKSMRLAWETIRETSKPACTIRALDAARIKTKGDLIFVFTTDEEGGLTGRRAICQRQ